MEYKEIVSVTNMPGLFHLIGSKNDGAIVRNLADKSSRFVSSRLHQVTQLETIEIYTVNDNVRLHEIFQMMKDSSEPMPDIKTADKKAILAYFKKVSPEIDEDRVYISDMKKMLKWYELLKANDLLHFPKPKAEGEEEAAETEAAETKEKPSTKASAEKETSPKAAKKSAETPKKNAVEKEEKPKKTAAKKKPENADTSSENKEETAGEKPAKKKAAPKKKPE